MKRLKILPGAAGVIALTATIGFIDGRREIRAEKFSIARITLVSALAHIAADNPIPGSQLDIKPETCAYLVEIRRGNIFADVLVDGVTGRVLLS